MKNHKIIRRIDCIAILWTLIDQNKTIYVKSMGKVISARFIRSWPLKAQKRLLESTEVFEVSRKISKLRSCITVDAWFSLEEARKIMRSSNIRTNFYECSQ